MKPSILSIGNATNDNYLEIDSQKFYKDEKNIFHYDLTFDDSPLEYRRKVGIWGGTLLSDQIFTAAHFKSFSSLNPLGLSRIDFETGNIAEKILTRYIISHQNKSVILTNNPRNLLWKSPAFAPDLIYVADTNFSSQYLAELRKYLAQNEQIEIVFAASDLENDLTREFLSRAKMVFVDFNKRLLSDLIDYTSVNSAIESLLTLGVGTVVIADGANFIAGNSEKIVKISSDFELNSFYQTEIFRAAFVAESFSGADIEESLATAMTIANKSDFNDVLKPLYARQVLSRKHYQLPIEVLRSTPNLGKKIRENAQKLVRRPKGIFAADESGGSIHKRFEEAGVADTYENRRKYREMFFTTPDIENYLSGVILFEETVEQSTADGQNFVDYLHSRGIMAGIKLDAGLQPLPGFEGETISAGLDSLDFKLKKYAGLGIEFAKWRTAFTIDEAKDTPTPAGISANVQVLARFAKACQNYGIVPIVEPEILLDGDYAIDKCSEVMESILSQLLAELKIFEVDLGGLIIKTNMISAGKNYAIKPSSREIGRATAKTLKKCLPSELAGVVFLSGGQTADEATENLQQIINSGDFDWGVTYSFARALQLPALNIWRGEDQNIEAAQQAFLERVANNSHALYKN